MGTSILQIIVYNIGMDDYIIVLPYTREKPQRCGILGLGL